MSKWLEQHLERTEKRRKVLETWQTPIRTKRLELYQKNLVGSLVEKEKYKVKYQYNTSPVRNFLSKEILMVKNIIHKLQDEYNNKIFYTICFYNIETNEYTQMYITPGKMEEILKTKTYSSSNQTATYNFLFEESATK